MRGLFCFLANPIGRGMRIMAGLALTLVGLLAVEAPLSWVLEVVGLVALLSGILGCCVLAPLFGLPFLGSRLRQEIEEVEWQS